MNYFVEEVTSKNILDQKRKRNVLLQGVVSTTALHYDVAVSGLVKCLRVRNIHELKRRVSQSPTDIQNASLCAIGLFVTSWLPLAVQCLCSAVSISCHPRPQSWTVWLIWWPNVLHWTSD